jgi:hypothetical protein
VFAALSRAVTMTTAPTTTPPQKSAKINYEALEKLMNETRETRDK